MNMGRNGVLLTSIVGGAALLLVGAELAQSGIALLLALACAAAGILLYGRLRNGRRPGLGTAASSGSYQAHVTAPVFSDYRRHSVTEVSLPSNREDYRFLFSATVLWWAPLGVPGDEPESWIGTAAAGAVIQRASTLTVKQDPIHSSVACHELALALREPFEVKPRIWVKAEDVKLTLSREDSERLAKLAEMRKDDAIWEYARRHEQSQRAYLADDVLKDPGSAVVWWLARHGDGDMRRAAENISHLTQISNAANNLSTIPVHGAEESQKPPADYLASFLQTMDVTEENQVLFACRVARIAENHGRHEIAEQIRQRFGVAADDDLGPLGNEDDHDG